jgi:hypothetical protein
LAGGGGAVFVTWPAGVAAAGAVEITGVKATARRLPTGAR